MKLRGERLLLSTVLCLFVLCHFGLAPEAFSQQTHSMNHRATSLCHTSDASSVVTLHGAQSRSAILNFCDGHMIGGGIAGVNSAEPLALASGDFDQDGMPDLVSAFKSGNGGKITVHRGNVAALWSYGQLAGAEAPSAFFSDARTLTVPEVPDFVVTGDFDADGHWDIVTGQRGSDSLYFLRGNGRGGFAVAKRIPVPGSITGMISGEMNRPDGLTDIILAVNTSAGARAVVLESPLGAVHAQPEIFKLPAPATALALGHFSGSGMMDLAIGSGNQLILIEGRDRKLSLDANVQAKVAAARVSSQQLSYSITALVTGDFTGTGPSVAALSADGRVHILEHSAGQSALAQKLAGDPNYVPSFQTAASRNDDKPAAAPGQLTPGVANRLAALRAQANTKASAWAERSAVDLPSGFSQSAPRLVAARVSGSLQDDILAADSGNRQIHVLSTAGTPRPLSSMAVRTSAAITPTRPAMKLLTSLSAESAPAAVLPMRLNKHGLAGLVTLHAGMGLPTVTPQDMAPGNVFVVTNTSDITSYLQKDAPPAGSLRAAMEQATAAWQDNSGGSYEIDFNIPTSDPGYNPTDGSFLIQPLSESVPNAYDNFALPPINATLIIDGYTRPGASPNTSATSDNAKILIRIDGAKASTPGGSGFVPFDDVGSVFRGLNITGWANPSISGNTASGGMGIEASGVGDIIEGNFFGTDPTATLKTDPKTSTSYGDRIGVFVDNGPLNNDGGNIIGGTTTQARNILSNNQVGGILFLSIGYEGQAQGNFIGLDHTGATPMPNTDDGVGANGPTIVIGGIAPHSGNVISQNGTNIDFNDITNGGVAANSFAWGNYLGTDSTGKIIFTPASNGISVTAGANNETAGGTTPAARNIISGNYNGVYIFDDTSSNIIQGNYIGTDVTGTKALGNSQQGYTSGASSSSTVPAVSNYIGGAVSGAGNVISGNGEDGIVISGTVADSNSIYEGSIIQGNYIGTDATGTVAIGNGATGVTISSNGTNNMVGGRGPGAGNLIANNSSHGVLIDPGTAGGQGTGNQTIGNTILSNGGAGVRVNSGTGERVSANSIYQNLALGIDIGPSGQLANSNCNSTNNGANMLLNAPVMTTGGSGSFYISATATDANGNTSDFSNAVPAILNGDQLSLSGTYNGVANASYTIEFFSSPEKDSSGFGQGKTFLGSASVMTDSSCNATFGSAPVSTTQADVSVSLTTPVYQLSIGPDFGGQVYTATVTNNGVATATGVKMLDTLPSTLGISSTYCDVAPCQTPVTTSLGTCSISGVSSNGSGGTLSCTIGTLAPGQSAIINIPLQAFGSGSIADTATVSADQTDSNTGNNSSTLTKNSYYPEPFIDTGTSGTIPNIVPDSALAGSSDTIVNIYGFDFLRSSTVTFNGTPVVVKGFVDNQTCNEYSPEYCAALQVLVPASLLTTAGTATIEVSDPDPGPSGGSNYPSDASFTIASSCTFTTDGDFAFSFIDQDGTDLIPASVDVTSSVPGCSWTATSSVPWIVLLDTHQGYGDNETNVADTGTATGSGTAEFAVAANTGSASRTGSITVAGQTFTFTQPGASSCDESIAPTSQSFAVAGGSGSFAVTSGCFGYYVQSYAPWITVAQNTSLLTDNASANFTVDQNTGGPRTGTITAGGAVYTVTQAAPGCYYTLDTTSALVAATGTTGKINVTASASTCAWTARPSSSQISISSGATGTGNGTVNYTVAPNTGAPVSPTITIGDASAYAVFTANEASPYTCTFTLTPSTNHVSSQGISTYFQITGSQQFCKWTATSSDPSVLTINGSGTGSGSGSSVVYYRVAQNDTGAPRTLTITAGCQTFTITQDAVSASAPVPTITAISPTTMPAASPSFTLTVTGKNFAPGATIGLSGVGIPTTYVSATQVTATVTTTDIALQGTYNVAVTNPSPGGGTSNALPLTITAATNNPVPVIQSMFPGSSPLNGPALTLSVQGLNYVADSTLSFNGKPIATTFLSGTVLTGVIPASALTANGTFPVVVTNPAPGGGTSNSGDFIVGSGAGTPTITLLQPSSIAAGSPAFTLNVIGTNYVNGAVVNFNGKAMTTTLLGGTELSAAIPASAITTQGTAPVTVTNPNGGGTSAAVNFSITSSSNPVPTVTSIQPTTVIAGSSAQTLTVNGTGFVSKSVVNVNGSARTTTYVSATQLTAALAAADVASAANDAITVSNPTPGGGTSNAINLAVVATPSITQLQPSTIAAGSAAFTLTVTGTNFVSGSVVNFAGNAMTTTEVSATQLTASIPATAITTQGTVSVTVTNPNGGGTSTALNFTITEASNPVPTIASIQPTTVTAGSGAQNLTVTGTNFISSSVVKVNGSARTTTYVSATKLTAALTAADVLSAGSDAITVLNPTPGDGTSNSVTLTVSAATPTITQLQPATIAAGSAAFTLTVTGTNFVSGSVVNFNGTAMTTTEVSATQLTASIPASAVTTQGTVPVTVTNPNGGGTSTAVNFTISAASNPVPTISSIQPTTVTAGSGAQSVTVNGTNFVSNSVVKVNGNARTTTYISATKITVALTAADVTSAGSDAITVTNPSPGGGTSNSINLVVGAATPGITQLQPATIAAGSAAFTLTVSGTNFVSGSVVSFNGTAMITTEVSSTQLTSSIPASAITTQGTVPVTVTNPNGGGTSAAVNFTITAASNPVPTIASIQPSTVTAGSGAQNLAILGTNFISGSVVKVNGSARTTTYVSATQLTAALTAADVASAGSDAITVFNPTPGGGTSNSVSLTVSAAAPTITQLQPSSIAAGSPAFTLTVIGANFVSGSVISFNNLAIVTTEVSTTQLTAIIPASAIGTAATVPVTVTNPNGGGTSAAASFIITAAVSNPVPTLTSIQPTSVTAGSGAQTLTLTGTNFIATSVVNVNGSARTTTYVSATQLTAALTAADVASAGSDSITVTNPAPGGGTTAAVTLTVTAPAIPGVSFDKTSISFGNEPQAIKSAAQTVNLTNSGTASLSISGITIGGSNPTDFAQTNNCPGSLNAGASCAISVTFTPASTGSYSATISVSDNASGSPQTVALSGTGTPPPSFTVTGPTGAQIVQPGGTAQFTITVAANNGTFPGSVALSASGLPPGAAATFSPPSLSPGSGTATSQLSIRTSSSASAAGVFGLAWPGILLTIPGILAMVAIGRRRKRLFMILLFLLGSFGAITTLSGCGGGFGIASRTYSITVTGTSGSEQQTTTIQLTVK